MKGAVGCLGNEGAFQTFSSSRNIAIGCKQSLPCVVAGYQDTFLLHKVSTNPHDQPSITGHLFDRCSLTVLFVLQDGDCQGLGSEEAF